MVMEGLNHALPQFLLHRSRNECSSLQCWMVAAVFLGLSRLTGQLFCCSCHLCVPVASALNRCPASCDMPGNWFWLKHQLANMAHYGFWISGIKQLTPSPCSLLPGFSFQLPYGSCNSPFFLNRVWSQTPAQACWPFSSNTSPTAGPNGLTDVTLVNYF